MNDYYPEMFVHFVIDSQHSGDEGLIEYDRIESLHPYKEGR